MNGLELSQLYYETRGHEMLETHFPDIFPRMAIGLVGEGSECFGFDDELSRDHDWGPAFCIWLEREDYQTFGRVIQAAYDTLSPLENVPSRSVSQHGQGRIGVLCTQDWYIRYTGKPEGPQTLDQWRRVPEAFLATATNGAVFSDPLGRFTAVREYLLRFYPEDVRLKKIAARAAVMSQAGQYNYPRCLHRGEHVAAQLALGEFMKAGLSMVYLLNRRYAPFYKWIHRGTKGLPILPRAYDLFGKLAEAADGVPRQELIERICATVLGELRRQQLTEGTQPFLEAHTEKILSHIQNPLLKDVHVMEE